MRAHVTTPLWTSLLFSSLKIPRLNYFSREVDWEEMLGNTFQGEENSIRKTYFPESIGHIVNTLMESIMGTENGQYWKQRF